eukprot:TRINITY_DN11956_c0_g1_i10.p1 TRINITY_DN11956_c0_g1~~TRINITY_DN11956_c0_g1_i10.p1  ORF type:complete len:148 (-),score=24.18 TRINITY_DN11956_c0_g1_i10:389-832(-)
MCIRDSISALQLPPQAAGLQCLPYHGTVCSGVVDYEYLPTPGQTAEEQDRSISDSLSKFEGKIYECRIAAKRYFCASAFSKCRQMKLPAGVPNVGVVPTFPTLPCKSVCKQYEAACGVTEESCNMLSNQKCNDLEKEDTSGYKRAEL